MSVVFSFMLINMAVALYVMGESTFQNRKLLDLVLAYFSDVNVKNAFVRFLIFLS